MKNTTLTMSFNTERLDDLTYHMGKKEADLQAELKEYLQKGFMLLSLPKPGKHRPAKPCGRTKVHNFFRDTEIFYACSQKSDRSFGDFGREKVNTRGE